MGRDPVFNHMKINTILVPLDCTDRSQPLLHSASFLATQFDAQLVLLHVYQFLEYVPAHMAAEDFDKYCVTMQQNAEQSLKATQRECLREPKVQSAQLLTIKGFFEEEIFKVAEEIKADLIVVSTHGYTGIRRFMRGSKAARLLRHAHSPILILPNK
ncbi:hypothetical protein BH09VER1_BH09VER1_29320 [soil metagenome]